MKLENKHTFKNYPKVIVGDILPNFFPEFCLYVCIILILKIMLYIQIYIFFINHVFYIHK